MTAPWEIICSQNAKWSPTQMTCLRFPSFVIQSWSDRPLSATLTLILFPLPQHEQRQPAVFFLTHLEFAATICACHPNGAFAHYTLVKCLAEKSSLHVSAAFYPSECCESSYVSIYSNQDMFCLSQQTSTGDENLQIRTTTLQIYPNFLPLILLEFWK